MSPPSRNLRQPKGHYITTACSLPQLAPPMTKVVPKEYDDECINEMFHTEASQATPSSFIFVYRRLFRTESSLAFKLTSNRFHLRLSIFRRSVSLSMLFEQKKGREELMKVARYPGKHLSFVILIKAMDKHIQERKR